MFVKQLAIGLADQIFIVLSSDLTRGALQLDCNPFVFILQVPEFIEVLDQGMNMVRGNP